MLLGNVLYHATVQATATRDMRVVSSDGVLDVILTKPGELGGTSRRGTNPEQLFAASYAASFLQTMRLAAAREGTGLPIRTKVEARVVLGSTERGFGLEVELRIWLPGLPRAEADSLVEYAHAACPYSNATRDNIAIRLVLA